MNLRRLAQSLGICFLFASCNKPEVKSAPRYISPPVTPATPVEKSITGQVFIVTQKSENIPLALVRVCVYPAEVIEQFILSESKASEEIRSQLKSRYDDVCRRVDKVKVPLYPGIEQLEHLNDDLNRLANRAPQEGEETRNRKRMLGYLTGLQETYEADWKSWPVASFYFDNLPKSIAEVLTDASGRFTIDVELGKSYVIGAQAERQAGDIVQHYYWLVKLDAALRRDGVLLLANHNTATSGSPESAVKCVAAVLSHPLSEGIEIDVKIQTD